MRVIAGIAKSLPLKTVEGLKTRPTTDRIKETLFNMLNPYLCDARFLDLFSGSGGIGIEAISRGASYCVFVENNRKAVQCIKDNLHFTRLSQYGNVLSCDVLDGLRQLSVCEKTFDVIFMDPPYNKQLEELALRALAQTGLCDEDTLIVVEASNETTFDYLTEIGFEIVRVKQYKTNVHVFIQKKCQ